MEKSAVDQLRFCAFCPNICRTHYPTKGVQQREYMAPSALSYLAYAVLNKFIVYDKNVEAVLSSTEACDSCREACPYHYNISGHLSSLVKELNADFKG